MNDSRKGKFYALIFLLFLLFLIVGGYFLTKELTRSDKKGVEKEQEKVEKDPDQLKIDKKEDFIYYENSFTASESHEIIYQDIIMNISGEEVSLLAEQLNQEVEKKRESIKKISEQSLEEEQKKIVYKEDDLYYAEYRKYTRYFVKGYASLVYDDYIFDCFEGSKYQESHAYVIDTKTGHVLTNDELMQKYDWNLEKIKSKVKETLESKQTLEGEESEIDVTATLTSLDDAKNYALYINKSGNFVISYIVKSNKLNYNDVIILN